MYTGYIKKKRGGVRTYTEMEHTRTGDTHGKGTHSDRRYIQRGDTNREGKWRHIRRWDIYGDGTHTKKGYIWRHTKSLETHME